MRLSVLLILLLIFSLPVQAEDDFLMPILPDAPIFADERFVNMSANRIVWLDNETIVFAAYHPDLLYQEEELIFSYHYELSTNSLLRLDESPFYANWDSQSREFFQAWDTFIQQSPYETDDNIPVIYRSNLRFACGSECNGQMMMSGSYSNDNIIANYSDDYYQPVSIPAQTELNIFWSRNLQATIIEIGSNYAGPRSLYHLDLQSNQETRVITEFEFYDGQILALSADGQSLVLETQFLINTSQEEGIFVWNYIPALFVWYAPYYDEVCHCTYEGRSLLIQGVVQENNEPRGFVGVGFVDEETILYIGNEGLYQHNLDTGESRLLNPEFNSHWINLAIFAPDNRHVAVTTEQGLYVLETGFTNP